jgi:hypothetical protein
MFPHFTRQQKTTWTVKIKYMMAIFSYTCGEEVNGMQAIQKIGSKKVDIHHNLCSNRPTML